MPNVDERRLTMPNVWGYTRASTDEQEETLHKQAADIRRAHDHDFAEAGFAFGGLFEDRGVSGGIRLVDRPAGYKLCLSVRPGDAVIITALDRAFRNLEDLTHTTKVWETAGVRLVILNLKIDTGTPVGKLILQILGAVAEFERSLIGERVRNWWSSRKARGVPAAGRYPPYGVRRVGRKGSRKYEPFPEQRALGARIVEWIDAGWSTDQVYAHLCREGITNPNTGEEVGRSMIQRYYRWETEARREDGVA
jgi:DNA invertase Pin-like site-specific DNA recombinase